MSTAPRRRILVTSALPYANGSLHIGNMLEHCLTDMWVRFQKMRGHDCLAICADDAHGAPIMVEARRRGQAPEAIIPEMRETHISDLAAFGIAYDNYGSTHCAENEELCHEIFTSLRDGGHIAMKTISQAYCPHDQMFLPDRFVKGECPKCGAAEQYGDSCDKCGSVYSPLSMKNPRCSICSNIPEERQSEHAFCKLGNFTSFLKEWVPAHTSPAVAKKLGEWLEGTLEDWCLTRDAPYFGFPVRDMPGKYFYVWFDAPVGYIASTWQWCKNNGQKLDSYWKDADAEIYHNIGKDIIYFHGLFWPMMLKAAGWNTPRSVWVHGMLTVDGEKLSKSKGTFINASTFAKHLDPRYLRYYLATKINESVTDIDLSWEDFAARINGELVGKITNIASRSAQLLQKRLDGRLGSMDAEGRALVDEMSAAGEEIAAHFEGRQFSRAMIAIRDLADKANKYVDDKAPWQMVKTDVEATRVVLTVALNAFRILAIYLKPVIPTYTELCERLFKEESFSWASLQQRCENSELAPFEHLINRVSPESIAAVIAATQAEQAGRK